MHRSLPLVSLALSLFSCVAVTDPASVNVEVVVQGAPADTAEVTVEITENSTGIVVDKNPVLAKGDLHVFFAVPAGDIRIGAWATNAAGSRLAQATAIDGHANASRTKYVAVLTAGPPPCVNYDRDGFACPEHFATLPFHASHLVPMGTSAHPAVLAVGDSGAAVLATDDGTITPVLDHVRPGAIVLSPDRQSALVPAEAAADAPSDVALVRLAPKAAVQALGVSTAPGEYGFFTDGTAWVLDQPTAGRWGTLKLAQPSDTSAGDPPDDCTGQVRGPLWLDSTNRAALFESSKAGLIEVEGAAFCARIGKTDGFGANAGSWGVSPDWKTFSLISADAMTGGSDLGLVDRDSATLTPVPLPADLNGNAYTPDGATAVTSDQTAFISTSAGIMAVAKDGTARSAVDHVQKVVLFDLREVNGKPVVLGATASGTFAFLPQVLDNFVVADQPLVWGTRLVGSDASVLAWEPGTQGSPAAWFFDSASDGLPRRLGLATPGAAARWGQANGETMVVELTTGLVDARTGTRLASARGNFAWDVGRSGLAYVEAVGSQAPYLLSAPGATPVALASSAADAVANDADQTGRFWVAFATQELARVSMPQRSP